MDWGWDVCLILRLEHEKSCVLPYIKTNLDSVSVGS